MKKTLGMLCITLLMTALLVGCAATTSPNTTAGTHRQSAPVNSTPAADDSTSHPGDTTRDPAESTTVPGDTTPDPAEDMPDPVTVGIYMLVNGTKIELGMSYADVKEALGAQTAPDQELGSCDNPTFVRIVHYYPGLTITENPDGTIWAIELSSMYAGESDAALMENIKIGTSMDEVISVLGEPENLKSAEYDCMLIYRQEDQYVCIYFFNTDNKDTVSGISMTRPME